VAAILAVVGDVYREVFRTQGLGDLAGERLVVLDD
jgi:hypothetical protein